MAKPVFSINVRASQTNYTTGPISTQTKDPRTAAQITEGYVPDSPLGTFPVPAQSVNFHDNQTDEIGVWVLDGTDQPDSTAHIVETSADGTIDTRRLVAEVSRFVGTASTDAVVITPGSAARGLVLNQDADEIGAEFIGATGPTSKPTVKISSESSTAEALNIDATIAANGITITAQNAIGVSIGMIETGGGDVGPNLFLATLSKLPTIATPAGTVWTQQEGGIQNLRAGMQVATPGYVHLSKHAPCYARSAIITSFLLQSTQTDQEVAGSFTWNTNMIPSDASKVRVTIWGQLTQHTNSATTATLKVRDTTAGSTTICSITIDSPDSGVGGTSSHSCTISQLYTLPGGGTRTFDLVWSGDAGAANGSLNVFVEIEDVRGE